jgi:succinate dehydrogenase / fumarate reductase cytochrome b subunit
VSSVAPAPPSAKSLHDGAGLGAEEPREIAKTRFATYDEAPGRRHFWLRRVHSLAGLAFGGYITVHLLVNATGFWPRVYQENVDKIHSLEPMLPLIEIVTIFIPLLIHALYGIYISTTGLKFNTMQYNYGGNVRYALQRWTSYILLLFVAYHIATLHKWGLALLGVQGFPQFVDRNEAYQSTARAIKSSSHLASVNFAVIGFYLLGTWSAVFHWANGLWTSAIAWGLTITANAQRKWGHVCFGFGMVLFLIGTMAWIAFGIAGDPNLPTSETWTLPERISQTRHVRVSGEIDTPKPLWAGEVPASEKH